METRQNKRCNSVILTLCGPALDPSSIKWWPSCCRGISTEMFVYASDTHMWHFGEMRDPLEL